MTRGAVGLALLLAALAAAGCGKYGPPVRRAPSAPAAAAPSAPGSAQPALPTPAPAREQAPEEKE